MNDSAFITDVLAKKHKEEPFKVMIFGPYTERRDLPDLLRKRENVREQIEDSWPYSVVKFIEDDDIQKHLKELQDKAQNEKHRYDYIHVLFNHFAPATDIFIFLVCKDTNGALFEALKLGLSYTYGPFCYIVYDDDDYELDRNSPGQGTYCSQINELVEGRDSQNHCPALVRALTKKEIIKCKVWSTVDQAIRSFLSQRSYMRRKYGNETDIHQFRRRG